MVIVPVLQAFSLEWKEMSPHVESCCELFKSDLKDKKHITNGLAEMHI